MSDTMNDPNKGALTPTPANDPNQGALTPTPGDAVDKVRPSAQQLRRTARATYRTMEGWQRVASEQDWLRITEESREAYESGAFLLEQLGAQRHLEPKLMATILALRQRLIDEWAITTAAETMLMDLALLNYYNALRVQGWTGDLAGRRRPRHHDEASVPRTNVACGFPALRSPGRLPALRRAASSRMKFRRR
jgi:hypothetical protein